MTQDDVNGNWKADLLAKDALKEEPLPIGVQAQLECNRVVTTAAQFMMVAIWQEHISDNN